MKKINPSMAIWRVLLIIILFAPIAFIIIFQCNHNKERNVLATSSDESMFAVLKTKQKGKISVGELWLINNKNKTEELLVSEKNTKEIFNPTNIKNPPKDIVSISEAKFSTDNKTLYFIDSLAYMTSGAIYSINLATKEIGFIGGSNYLDVIKDGKYKDYLILNKHKYFPAGGSYDYYYIVNPKNGEEVKPIGNSLDGLSNFSWENSLLNLSVPAKFSDFCGFMAKNCEGFNFVGGQWSDKIKNTPFITLNTRDAIYGKLKTNNEKFNIIITPYSWNQNSSNNGIYIIKDINNKLEIIARINYGEKKPDILNIYEDSIYIISIGDKESHSKICTFKNGVLSEESLFCKDSTF